MKSFMAVLFGLMLLAPLSGVNAEAPAGSKAWNGGKITWHNYKDGLAAAKSSGKPIFMVVHTTWCPYCKAYRKHFYNRQVEKLAKKFVFVMIDQDKNKGLSRRYAPDGEYIPRTMILSSTGKLNKRLSANNRTPRYFIDVRRKYGLPNYMRTAARQYRR